MLNESVLARINLDAVLSNLEIMAQEDPQTKELAKKWNGTITFKVGLNGPVTTLEIKGGNIRVFSGSASGIVLFFPCNCLLNNMFSGEGVGFPIPVKGFTKMAGLLNFIKLAERMEEILKGDNPPVELKAKLLLNTVAKTMAIIANYDPSMAAEAAALHGVAQLSVRDGYAVNVTFTGSNAIAANSAAKDFDLLMEFKDSQFFIDLADDKVDTFAAMCLRDLVTEGDLHMADIVNVFLDKIGTYLA